eukprot:TRINITY_DN73448_c0_g1_i1.p1 TRINITY_DN73448_c0_g1~~TRINITY_DN73448_c0_g1_i1.p1  ORF type:complete len:654 (-),score=157.09 TRINITY_DN73448_c0_g1_i1:155-2116(-)
MVNKSAEPPGKLAGNGNGHSDIIVQTLQEQHEELLARLDVWMKTQESRLEEVLAGSGGVGSKFISTIALSTSMSDVEGIKSPTSLKNESFGSGDISPRHGNGFSHGSMTPVEVEGLQSPKSCKSPARKPVVMGAEKDLTDDVEHHDEEKDPFGLQAKLKGRDDQPVTSVSDKIHMINEERSGSQKTGSCLRSTCKKITTSPCFVLFFAVLIIVNSLYIGFELQMSIDVRPKRLSSTYTVVGHLFSLLWLIELVLKLLAEGRKFLNGPNWGWNMLDAFLVVSSIVDFVVSEYNRLANSEEAGRANSLSAMRLLRIVRSTRLLRLVRVARLLRFVGALNLLVFSILITIRSLLWATILIILIIYFFGVLVSQGVVSYLYDSCHGIPTCAHYEELDRYWGNLPRACLTLFQIISGGKDWDDATSPLQAVDGVLLGVVVAFIIFCQFAVLNVVTGVFCQAAMESAQRDREMMVSNLLQGKQRYIDTIGEQFANMFVKMGGGEDGLSLEVFQNNLSQKAVREYFALLELDVSDAWLLFKLLDEDESGLVDAEEFVAGCLKLKGSARGIDLAKLNYENISANKYFHTQLLSLRSTIEQLTRVLVAMQHGELHKEETLHSLSQYAFAAHSEAPGPVPPPACAVAPLPSQLKGGVIGVKPS